MKKEEKGLNHFNLSGLGISLSQKTAITSNIKVWLLKPQANESILYYLIEEMKNITEGISIN
ncbi:hypothetical protein [uncultured Cyclobacterium sp.]|uniref:hypothetical protein n=1 Tax=uncultured Cyclobacterium sp. TaxID=453820 RepID=UPI0030EE1234